MLLAVSTDMLTAGSHFFPDAEPGKLGHKALAACLPRLHTPEPRVDLGVRLRGLARSAIDVSDGLLADLGHILEASRVGAELAWENLPRARAIAGCPDKALADDCLLAGGDDYELLFTASKVKRAQIEAVGRDLEIPLALIGAAVPGDSVARLRDPRRKLVSRSRRGLGHLG